MTARAASAFCDAVLLAQNLVGLGCFLGGASLVPPALLVRSRPLEEAPTALESHDLRPTKSEPASARLDPEPRRPSFYYVRMSAGYGVTAVDITSDPEGPPESGRVPGLALDFLLGITPVTGLSLGAAMLVDTGPFDSDDKNPSFHSEQDAGLLTFGAFADVFPFSALGLHAGGMFGHATFTLNDRERNSAVLLANGFAGAFWLGYDGNVDPEWSLGSMLRVSAAHTEEDGVTDFSVSSQSIAIMFSALHR